jgi:hypothetical protein
MDEMANGAQRIVLSGVPFFARCFALVFAVVGALGVFAMLTGAWATTISTNHGSHRPATPADAWFPGIFLLLGMGMLFVRHRVVLDAGRKVCTKASGWGLWVRRTETSLGESRSLSVGPAENRGGGSGRYQVFPIRALGPHGGDELAAPRTEKAAMKLAGRIAQALRLPLGQGLAGSSANPQLGTGGSPATGAGRWEPEDVVPPAGTRVVATEIPRGLEIRYPMVHIGRIGIAGRIAVPALLLLAFWWFLWRPGQQAMAAKSTIAWLFMMAPLIMGLFSMLVQIVSAWFSGKLGGRILVDADGGLTALRRTVRAEQISDLEIVPGRGFGSGLRVVLPTSSFLIAPGQSAEDLRWIRALILKHLGARIGPAQVR